MEQVLSNHGAGGRDRTGDLLITRESTAPDAALTCGKVNTAAGAEAHSAAPENGEAGKDTGKDEVERIRAAIAGRYPGDRIETGPFLKACPCGAPSDGWSGDGDAELCQVCWESYCNRTWWAAVDTRALVEPVQPASRWRGVVLTGGVVAGPHGTETQTPHEQASFADIVKADDWIRGRVKATRCVGVLLVEGVEAMRVYKPEPKPAPKA